MATLTPLTSNSNLPTINRIKYEDYKGAPAWFAQFLNTLNLFMTAVYNIINGGILYTNIGCIQPFSFSYTQGTTTNFSFTNPLSVVPNNVIIGNVWTGNTQTHPSGYTQLYWHYAGGQIVIDAIIGLTVGVNYTLTVMVS
jgi:hypothetical protein